MDVITKDVRAMAKKELAAANRRFRMFASPHEGYAVIREELDELIDEVRKLHFGLTIRLWRDVKRNEPMKREHLNLIYDVAIQRVSGKLTDHYDPRNKTLNLSDAVYASTSVAAVGVAAHECGHAIQHARGYAPLSFRSALVPVANIGSQLSWLFIILGIFFGGSHTLIMIGILMFSAAVLFQLVTLPVEFNASGRALKLLSETGILQKDEVSDTRKVLSAAALTYVAAAATAVLQLLRLLRLFGGNDRD